jgi:hypothetical protein
MDVARRFVARGARTLWQAAALRSMVRVQECSGVVPPPVADEMINAF